MPTEPKPFSLPPHPQGALGPAGHQHLVWEASHGVAAAWFYRFAIESQVGGTRTQRSGIWSCCAADRGPRHQPWRVDSCATGWDGPLRWRVGFIAWLNRAVWSWAGLSLGALLALQAGLSHGSGNTPLLGLLLYAPPIRIRDSRRLLAPLLVRLMRTLPKRED